MSYSAMGEYYETTGLGSYYEFSPHEVYPTSGYGSYYAQSGLGSVAAGFSADRVWADVQLGGSCYAPGVEATPAMRGKCNAAGKRATELIQAALSELGYGPLAVDGKWGGQTKSTWNRFMDEHNLDRSVGEIQKSGLVLMERLLQKGDTPGPAEPAAYEKVSGAYIPVEEEEEDKIQVAGMSGSTLLLAALAVGAGGYLLYKAGQKKKRGVPRRVGRSPMLAAAR